ncbi:MAG: carbamoyltransferase C-terminal domain-containing protein [bacterium]|nr:carbamoyltransferase C-terminal domain-containing protein [bacterium]
MSVKTPYILGINGSHGASAALLKNGELIACAQEERFTRKKNQPGYPKHAIKFCLEYAGITTKNLNGVSLGFKNPTLFIDDLEYTKTVTNSLLSNLKSAIRKPANFLGGKHPIFHQAYELHKKTPLWGLLARNQRQFLANQLRIAPAKIHCIDHHTSHGFAAYYSNPDLESLIRKKTLVITLDGAGDGVSSRIFLVENDRWTTIASTPEKYTLGWLYEYVTQYLGMKPNEDEYKVMGLAPYADKHAAEKVYLLFKKMMSVEGLSIQSDIPRVSYPAFLEKYLAKTRFDAVAGGIQKLTEELTCELVQNACKETGVSTVILCGGVFMNVKANMRIAELPDIKKLFVMPSCTDDSTSIGAAYYGYLEMCRKEKSTFSPKPPKTMYLGPQFSKKTIRDELNLFRKKHPRVQIRQLKSPAEEIAQLLSKGFIVAHFKGRMEYGARALGNRSILADPRNAGIVKILNTQIKNRDFWMPFAPTILEENADEYIINPKHIHSPYMMVAFHTTEKAKKDIIATLHPYDGTARAQILRSEQNPAFYQIIKAFERATGVGALLNTSFNLHGEPIVCTPEDALHTFSRSGLRYLVLEDHLLTKSL